MTDRYDSILAFLALVTSASYAANAYPSLG